MTERAALALVGVVVEFVVLVDHRGELGTAASRTTTTTQTRRPRAEN